MTTTLTGEDGKRRPVVGAAGLPMVWLERAFAATTVGMSVAGVAGKALILISGDNAG